MKLQKQPRASRVLAAFAALVGIVLSGTVSAVTVTSASDNPVNQPLIPGTLRYVIATAPDNDTITFANNLKGKTITLKGGQLVLNRSLKIQGPGVDKLAVSGANVSRVFLVAATGSVDTPPAVISDLTITKGNGTGVDQFGNPAIDGGAVYNSGNLTLLRCAVKNSTAAGNGGGVFNTGTGSQITDSTVAYNTATGDGGGICNTQNLLIQRCAVFSNTAGGSGGGIQELGTATYINSTIASNTASGSGGGVNDGGGATINVYNCTISLNTASLGGGLAVPFSGASTTLRNTIVASNSPSGPPTPAPDVSDVFIDGSGILISMGHNLIGTTVGTGPGSFLPSDQLNVNPKLGSLKDNGGITLTMELLPGSPAINAGDNANLLPSMTTDQRGTFNRIINGTVDVGAFEFIAPRSLKNGALSDLSSCAAGPCDSDTRSNLRKAIRNIQKSLVPSLWSDDLHLTKCGELVFEFEEQAVESLLDIVDGGGSCAHNAQNAIDDLELAAELLARIAISDAITGGGTAKYICSAQANLAKGLDALAKGKFHQATDFYEQAWIDAQHARGLKCGCDDDDERSTRDCVENNDRTRNGNDD